MSKGACNGVVVIKFNDKTKTTHVVIVRTPSGTNYGFPKGKRKTKEDPKDASLRELFEETGIIEKQINIVPDVWIEEKNKNDNVSVSYLVATYIDEKDHQFVFDPEELAEVKWYTLEDAYKVLWENRASVLRQAVEILTKQTTTTTKESTVTKALAPQQLTKLSKKLSWILRYHAKELGLDVRDDAYVPISQLLKLKELSGATLEEIRYVVDNNDKKRFSLTEIENKLYIRANQGHSGDMSETIKDDKLLTKIEKPLNGCIHGTSRKAWEIIKKEGLNKMDRMHIHFATGNDAISGYRKTSQVLIELDMESAMKDCIEFFLSDNGVVLSSGIDGIIHPKYLRQAKY